MLRPPRSKTRFQGDVSGTSLSNPYAEADGRRMRRRYAFYGIMGIIIVGGLIALIAKNTGNDKEAPPQAPKGSYILESQATIAEANAHIEIYKHSRSGMSVMAMVPEDGTQDAVFGLNFRTKSEDDTGAAYIVEKSIQDGSKNFPIKDPYYSIALL